MTSGQYVPGPDMLWYLLQSPFRPSKHESQRQSSVRQAWMLLNEVRRERPPPQTIVRTSRLRALPMLESRKGHNRTLSATTPSISPAELSFMLSRSTRGTLPSPFHALSPLVTSMSQRQSTGATQGIKLPRYTMSTWTGWGEGGAAFTKRATGIPSDIGRCDAARETCVLRFDMRASEQVA